MRISSKNVPRRRTLKTYDALDQMQIDLATGRMDTAFADVCAAKDFLAKPDGKDFQFVDVKIRLHVRPDAGRRHRRRHRAGEC
jgi:octopine/nopaline transport system substrate-binding protein